MTMDATTRDPAPAPSPWHPRRWLPLVATAGLGLFACGFYLAPDYGAVARVFYLLMLLPALVALLSGQLRGLAPVPLALFLLPAAWLALSTLWATDPGGGERSLWYLCKPLPMLAGLYLALCLALAQSLNGVRLLLQALVLAAGASAALSLLDYLPQAVAAGEWPRLAGISLRGDINVTAALYGANCLFCAWGLLHWSGRWRWPVLASFALSAAAIVLSRSKIPQAAALVAAAWLLLELRRDPRLRHLPWAVLALAVLLPLGWYVHLQRVPFLDRPEGYHYRLDIWSQALAQWAQRPWFGHGVGTDLPLELWRPGQPVFDSHAHNLLLETLRYGGLVGLGLLLLQWIYAARAGLRLAARRCDYVPVLAWWVYGIGFLLTNGQQPLVKPHHVWFFYWLPLGLLLAGAARERALSALPARGRGGS